jgi:hypothetical protein
MADATDLQLARVCLNEARSRRNSPHKAQRAYSHQLLTMAACARLRYMADRIMERWSVQQPDLFSSAQPGAEKHE